MSGYDGGGELALQTHITCTRPPPSQPLALAMTNGGVYEGVRADVRLFVVFKCGMAEAAAGVEVSVSAGGRS